MPFSPTVQLKDELIALKVSGQTIVQLIAFCKTHPKTPCKVDKNQLAEFFQLHQSELLALKKANFANKVLDKASSDLDILDGIVNNFDKRYKQLLQKQPSVADKLARTLLTAVEFRNQISGIAQATPPDSEKQLKSIMDKLQSVRSQSKSKPLQPAIRNDDELTPELTSNSTPGPTVN